MLELTDKRLEKIRNYSENDYCSCEPVRRAPLIRKDKYGCERRSDDSIPTGVGSERICIGRLNLKDSLLNFCYTEFELASANRIRSVVFKYKY